MAINNDILSRFKGWISEEHESLVPSLQGGIANKELAEKPIGVDGYFDGFNRTTTECLWAIFLSLNPSILTEEEAGSVFATLSAHPEEAMGHWRAARSKEKTATFIKTIK